MKIATRTLNLIAGDRSIEVVVDIFAPTRDGDAWTCEYQIGWPNRTWKSFAAGIDSAQALILALQKIGVEVYSSEPHKAGTLVWQRPGGGYGFPSQPSLRDDLVGDDRKYY